eukprot:229932-Pyramimonas_sp.AAC.1
MPRFCVARQRLPCAAGALRIRQVDAFEALLGQSGVPAEIKRFEGAGHAFVTDLRGIEEGGDAGRAWGLFTDFLRTHLQA